MRERETEDLRALTHKTRHSVSMEGREKVSITGVSDVSSFNEAEISAHTEAGILTVFGTGLHITKLDLDAGVLHVEGAVGGMEYTDYAQKQSGVFSRLFR